MKLLDFCEEAPATVTPEATVKQAIELMLERSVSIFLDRIVGFEPATLRAGIVSLRAEAEAEIRGRIRRALSLFTLNCLARRGNP